MQFYPINLRINGRECMVIGGGAVAERKTATLLAAGAQVTVLSPRLTSELSKLAENKKITYIARVYQKGDIRDYFIVICATDNPEVNQAAAVAAKKAGALVNVADAPDLCDFTVPSHIVRGDLMITVSTGGKSPRLTKRLKEELAECYGPEYGLYLELIGKVRSIMKESVGTARERERFWQETIDSEVLALLREGKLEEAEEKIRNATSCIRTQS